MSENTRQVIQRFWHTANTRNWEQFAELLHPELLYLLPQTRECVKGRTGFVDLFRTWPGQWRADVEVLIAEPGKAVSTINFIVDGEEMTGISFFDLSEGLVYRITDYWPSSYEPPVRATPYMERF